MNKEKELRDLVIEAISIINEYAPGYKQWLDKAYKATIYEPKPIMRFKIVDEDKES